MMRARHHGLAALIAGAAGVLCLSPDTHAETTWAYKGELLAFPNASHVFNKDGDGGVQPEVQTLGGMSALYQVTGAANPGVHTLKSSSLMTFVLQHDGGSSWQKASALGTTATWYADQLVVRSGPGEPGGNGFLEFKWQLDGKLSAVVESEPGLYDVAYQVGVELFAVVDGGARVSIFQDSIQRGQADVHDILFDYPVPVNPGFKPDASVLGGQRSHDQDLSKSVLVAFQPGTAVDVSFHLFTGVSLVAEASDTGDLSMTGNSAFGQTATLTSVRVLDENLQPYSGPFELGSANGFTYPVAAVPEPGAYALMAAGLFVLCLAMRRSARRVG